MNALLTATPLADTWGMHDVGAGWWIVMMLLMIAFWAAVLWGVVWLARGGQAPQGARPRETPAEILDRRLADGTLSPEEYEQRRRLLEQRTPASTAE